MNFASDNSARHRTTVLVVEHTAVLPTGIAAALADGGLHVVECPDGAAAIDMLSLMLVDVIVAAVDAPAVESARLLQQARALPGYADVPVVLLTCRCDPAAEAAARQAGVAAWLERPVTRERLRDVVARCLAPATRAASAPLAASA
ncbi:response regulator [Opitutus sp. ER46]|uniref:response regulator n=1 Tax=Opitutus sp. ER46 TaxID=2161864 RepID=UPI000D31A13D|nr:response regulator [Opitutus sp. ER46]PTX90703.1 hypothetical protein DB354_18750 [Opitutus sp. ER46]